MKYRATFLTFLFGDYEKMHEVAVKTPNCDYVLVTDNKDLKSNTWNIKYVDNPHPEDNFYMCWEVRYNPFKYIDTDIVIRIDGSMECSGDFTKVLDYFEEGGYDTAVCIHPTRNNIYEERCAWVQHRGYPIEQANKVLTFMAMLEGYDVKAPNGLIQLNFAIQRNTKIINTSNQFTRALLTYLAPEDKLEERLDQDIYTFVLNKYFRNMKVLPLSQDIAISGVYFNWYAHNSDNKMNKGDSIYCQPYLFGEPINTVYLGE